VSPSDVVRVPGPRTSRRHRRANRHAPWLLWLLVLVSLVAGCIVVAASWSGISSSSRRSAVCPQARVELVVVPEVAQPVRQAVSGLDGRVLSDGRCLQVLVREQDPQETIASGAVLPVDRWPQLWIPDSSLWASRPMRFATSVVGHLAYSPVVLGASPQTAQAAGWQGQRPTWIDLLGGRHAVSLPDPSSSATSLLTLLALRTSLGDGASADRAIAGTLLVASRTVVPSPTSAVDRLIAGGVDAPLVPMTEQGVAAVNAVQEHEAVVPVYPRNGGVRLDYPVVRIAANSRMAAPDTGLAAVLAALNSEPARKAVRNAGFRDSLGVPPHDVQAAATAVAPLPTPGPVQVGAELTRLASLAKPSRLLTVVDISASMAARVNKDLNRIELAVAAAASAGRLLPDDAMVGLWSFSASLDPGRRPWTALASISPLGSADGSMTHRERVDAELAQLPHQLGGGTALYTTALDAVHAVRAGFDENAANAVVLITDGRNEDATGMSLEEVVGKLQADRQAGGDRSVRLIAIGIGPDIDTAELQQLATATNGYAYQANSTEELESVLYDAISRRN